MISLKVLVIRKALKSRSNSSVVHSCNMLGQSLASISSSLQGSSFESKLELLVPCFRLDLKLDLFQNLTVKASSSLS